MGRKYERCTNRSVKSNIPPQKDEAGGHLTYTLVLTAKIEYTLVVEDNSCEV